MRTPRLLSCFATLVLAATTAFAQVPTFTVVNTGLDATFGNAGKALGAPQVTGLQGVAFGAGLFVVIGNSNGEDGIRWATSPDGTTWTGRTQALTGGMKSFSNSKVHFLNGKFMFIAAHTTPGVATSWCYTSADGLTWTANKIADFRIGFEEFDSSPTLTVIAGSNGGQMVSSDLVTWTHRPVVPNGAGYDHNDVAFGNGRFFSSINGFGGATYSSTDAVTWTAIPAAAAAGGGRIETGNGLVLLSGATSRLRSTDGITFTAYTPRTSAATLFLGGNDGRFTNGRFITTATDLSTGVGLPLRVFSTDGLNWSPLGNEARAPASLPGTSRSYGYTDIAYGNGKYVLVGSDVTFTAASTTYLPLITTVDATAATAPTITPTTVTATGLGAGATVQWQRNGTNVSGATSASYTLADVQPTDAGLYLARVTTGTTVSTQPFVVGVPSTVKVVGTGAEILSNQFVASNNNTFDQVALQGVAATITADSPAGLPPQITRMSFVDLSDDIVQVEFSGAGSLSLVLDGVTGPATPTKYNQPATTYFKGHAGIVIVGANETTNVSVFSVGSITAVNQTLFKTGVTYDGLADVAFIAISSTNGKFGGIRTSNASYFATKGYTGIYAPGIQFTGPVFVGDISASDNATPVLLLGSVSDARITGGDLLQANGQAISVSGITQLNFTAGATSHGVAQAAQTNKGVLRQGTTDVTSQIVVNPATTGGTTTGTGKELTFFAGTNPPYANGTKKTITASLTTLQFDSTTLTNPVPLTTLSAPFSGTTFTDPATGIKWETIFNNGSLYEINLLSGSSFRGQWSL